jgi:hypothetical protein
MAGSRPADYSGLVNNNTNSNLTWLSVAAATAILYSMAAATLQAGVSVYNSTSNLGVAEESGTPNAVVLSVRGNCEYSQDGTNFTALTARQVLTQGALIRTGEKSRADLFFRRVGTTARLQENTVVKLEKMARSKTNDIPELDTLLDLRKGRIFTVVRSIVEGSTFEIRNAAGRSVVEGAPAGSTGRYIITADGTQIAHKSSNPPIKLIGENGITVIMPGQKFDAKEGKPLPLSTPETVEWLIEWDELAAMTEEQPQPTNK